ncbi:hypothetical protein BDV32DRAFT_106759 [Aspergillus pseudonomiae]|uniref:Uncharacterized protein n=1 Tax=Aspergillus pseudonomiae TaxID=1506151 RepID=A0A5N6HQN3_9EURO|nr:uncharacterized protein BDV37DRAFT_57382 [Aspergillus pseudonomiae]KAB8256007.1 hypothetical protein BDV32DRAFT_106759 [Aspergillus pseudonomiae]KAE8406481.1 hypothetical protein BDV37DRAFT_57382 [Aspergillus pseudonomiae]
MPKGGGGTPVAYNSMQHYGVEGLYIDERPILCDGSSAISEGNPPCVDLETTSNALEYAFRTGFLSTVTALGRPLPVTAQRLSSPKWFEPCHLPHYRSLGRNAHHTRRRQPHDCPPRHILSFEVGIEADSDHIGRGLLFAMRLSMQMNGFCGTVHVQDHATVGAI